MTCFYRLPRKPLFWRKCGYDINGNTTLNPNRFRGYIFNEETKEMERVQIGCDSDHTTSGAH